MYNWVKEDDTSMLIVPVTNKMRDSLCLFLNQENVSSQLYATFQYFLDLWYFWGYHTAHELLRKTKDYSQELISMLDVEMKCKISAEEYAIVSQCVPGDYSLTRLDNARELLYKTIDDKDIPGYMDSYMLSPDHTEIIAGVKIPLVPETMLPRLTTLGVIDQVMIYIKKNKNQKYRLVDIGTGGTGYIPRVIKNYIPSLPVMWFDVDHQLSDDLIKKEGDYSSWDKIRKVVPKDRKLIITANLPYSPEQAIQQFHPIVQKESIASEYRSFKWWDNDGLGIYKKYLDDLSENNNIIELLVLEAHIENIHSLMKYAQMKFTKSLISLHMNFEWLPRIIRIEIR